MYRVVMIDGRVTDHVVEYSDSRFISSDDRAIEEVRDGYAAGGRTVAAERLTVRHQEVRPFAAELIPPTVDVVQVEPSVEARLASLEAKVG